MAFCHPLPSSAKCLVSGGTMTCLHQLCICPTHCFCTCLPCHSHCCSQVVRAATIHDSQPFTPCLQVSFWGLATHPHGMQRPTAADICHISA